MATETTNYKFQKPAENEFYDVDVQNQNWDTADEKLKKLDDEKVDASGGDIAATKVGSITASTASYPVPAANDTVKVGFGKIVKFFGDIRNWMTGVCLIGQIVNNCVTNNAGLPLSAAQGKVLMDLFTKLNSDLTAKRCITNSTPSNFSLALTATLKYLSTAWIGTATCPYLTANSLGITVNKTGYYLIHMRLSLTTDVAATTILRLYRGIRHVLSGVNDDKIDALYINGSAQMNDYTNIKYCQAGEVLRPIAYTSDANIGTITISSVALQVSFLST